MTSSNLQHGRSCNLEERRAKLSSDFGISLLKKKVSEERFQEIMEEVGVLKAGKNKGLPRGHIVWTKVVEGGFDYQKGRVLRGGCVDFFIEWEVDGVKRKTAVSNGSISHNEAMQSRIPELESRMVDLEKLVAQCDKGIVREQASGDHDMVEMYHGNRKLYQKELDDVSAELARITR